MPTKGLRKVYFSLELSPTQRLVLFGQTYQGTHYNHLRLWYQPEVGADFKPGKGLVLPSNPVTLHQLADALREMAQDYPWTDVKKDSDGGSGFGENADNTGERRIT